MSRIHGRRGAIYFDGGNTGAASPLAYQAKWTISFVFDKPDVTAFGDPNKVYVAGLPDASGDFSGFYDDSTAQTYTAATDGIPRKFYLYPSSANTAQYWFGMIMADFKADGDVKSSVNVSCTWVASSLIAKAG